MSVTATYRGTLPRVKSFFFTNGEKKKKKTEKKSRRKNILDFVS